MAFLQYNAGPAPQQLTGLAIVRGHRIYLVQGDTSTDIREIFFPWANISTVYEHQVDIGQGRSYTELRWTEPIDDLHVPGLESLLRWMRNSPTGPPGVQGLRGLPAPALEPLSLRGPRGHQGLAGNAGPRGHQGLA